MKRFALISGSLLGASAVALGAIGAHALKNHTSDPAKLAAWETGAHYQLFHAIVLIIIGLLLERKPSPLGSLAGVLFFSGIILFSGSIYTLVLTDLKALPLVMATPIGGVSMITAWILLFFYFFKEYK